MSISVAINHRLGSFHLDASFESAGRLTALFGRSGSGKTSVINAISGLTRPAEARIVADDRVLVDTASRTFLPPHRRRIGYVFQDARLFPHLSVAQNLRYGRFFTPKTERYAAFDGIVDLLGIAQLLDRMPGQLSGGEKQRVAIAAAIAAGPALLIADEATSALDTIVQGEIVALVERLVVEDGMSLLFISHDMALASQIAERIAVFRHGRMVEIGSAGRVVSAPNHPYTRLLLDAHLGLDAPSPRHWIGGQA